jgi:gluconolactonase
MKLKSLIEPGDPERIATGFEFTEGPVWHPDGYLIFSDIPASRTYTWRPDGSVAIWREPTGNANGLTLDRERRLIACEHGGRRVSRVAADGTAETLADSYGGRRLNSPNDVVVKSDGTIYFTDPPYGLAPPHGPSVQEQEQPCNGLYRIKTDGKVELLIDDFDRPNGLAFSADESILYVDDSPRRYVRAFDVRPDGTLANSRLLADMDHPQPGSPDGMKIDSEGHLFVTGATGVWVFEPDGTCLGVVVTPERPANCAWGDADRQTLYITARTSVYRLRTTVPGLPGVWLS